MLTYKNVLKDGAKTPEEIETQVNICTDILKNTKGDPKFLENVITCDELWDFQYD